MCRLFGFRSAVLSRAHRSLIAADNALQAQAQAHPHGWGIGYFQGSEAFLLKSEVAAAECPTFRRAADRLASNTLVAHVRKATVGAVGPKNTHPFRIGRWLFAHNGTIHGFEGMEARMAAATPEPIWSRRLGETDSEAFFCFLLGKLAERGVDVDHEEAVPLAVIAAATASAMASILAWGRSLDAEPAIVNFLLTNGPTFAAHRHGRELFFSTQKLHCRDSANCPVAEKPCLLAVRPHAHVNHLLVASEPIGDEDVWEAVPENSLVGLEANFHLQQFATA